MGNLSLCHSRITDQMIHKYRELTATTDEKKAKNKKNARPGPPLDTCGRQERVINSSSQNEPDINKHRVIRTDYRGSTMYVGASSCIQSTYPPLTCLRRFSILALYACVDIGSLSPPPAGWSLQDGCLGMIRADKHPCIMEIKNQSTINCLCVSHIGKGRE